MSIENESEKGTLKELEGVTQGAGFIADVEAFVISVFGASKGKELFRALYKPYKGGDVFVPGMTPVYRQYRDEIIKGRFKGSNIEELALEFKLSVRHIRRILSGK